MKKQTTKQTQLTNLRAAMAGRGPVDIERWQKKIETETEEINGCKEPKNRKCTIWSLEEFPFLKSVKSLGKEVLDYRP